MVKDHIQSIRNIRWDKVFAETCCVLWTGFLAFFVLCIAFVCLVVFLQIPHEVKIFLGVVLTFIVGVGSIMRYVFGIRDF